MNGMNFCDNETVKIEFLNGTLKREMLRNFEAHLQGCERCRSQIDELRSVIAGLESIATPAVPEELSDRVRKRLRAERRTLAARMGFPRRAPRFNRIVFALCTAGILIASFALFTLFTSGPVGGFLKERLLPPILDMIDNLDPEAEGTVNALGVLFTASGILLIPSITENLYMVLRNRHAASRT
jgi:hypothetical protein